MLVSVCIGCYVSVEVNKLNMFLTLKALNFNYSPKSLYAQLFFLFCSFVILPDFSLSHLTFSSTLNEMEKKLFGENMYVFGK